MLELKDIEIKDLSFTPFILRDDIKNRIQELAIYINDSYENKCPIFVSVLNGSFMFTSDLIKQIDIQSEINFIKLSSYDGTSSSGKVKESLGFGKWVTDRHIIIIEDIIDSGKTMKYILDTIEQFDPASVEIVTLFLKKECLDYDIEPKYVGFNIPNKFIVGYGLDYDGFGRNYEDVYQLI